MERVYAGSSCWQRFKGKLSRISASALIRTSAMPSCHLGRRSLLRPADPEGSAGGRIGRHPSLSPRIPGSLSNATLSTRRHHDFLVFTLSGLEARRPVNAYEQASDVAFLHELTPKGPTTVEPEAGVHQMLPESPRIATC